ncbi:hypothetical protein OIT44_05325 [Weissella ceti]|uniref:Lipoprotein n=1 Tax=Weissella ceti TaxID=759620 RepID=A0ABT3E4Y1_9LACO|nr:hypothetical protein [Weissella ceti]MCW0953490.1 hypothetical protein [Weissella ceti]QVK12077.1 hypothetical protein KHQ31_07700 [Weissella ceti]
MSILSNIWVKIILAIGLVGGGVVGVSAVLNNKSADTESAASSSSSKAESKKVSSKPKETALTPEQKLLVLMDNQKTPVAITTSELRNGSYESSAMGPGDKTEAVTTMTVTPMDSTVSETVIASAPSKGALAFDVKPNRGGSMTGLLIESDKSTLFMGQNFTGIEYDRLIQHNEYAVSMTNSEMEKYFKDHQKTLDELTSKIKVSGIDSPNTQTMLRIVL